MQMVVPAHSLEAEMEKWAVNCRSVLCQFFILGSVHDMILMKIFGSK